MILEASSSQDFKKLILGKACKNAVHFRNHLLFLRMIVNIILQQILDRGFLFKNFLKWGELTNALYLMLSTQSQ